jgi:hypothetical protein
MASRAERAIFWLCAKTFLHPIARFAAHLMVKIQPMEYNDLQSTRLARFARLASSTRYDGYPSILAPLFFCRALFRAAHEILGHGIGN